ncbi:MAG: hypothetical protein GY829_07275 [Gammaproteobacteria bacterium]|nr:hypothetical protein [Gammaproteobacteria bacterium]
MSEVIDNKNILWNSQMPDRRKNDRRNNVKYFQPNGKSLNISDMKNLTDRRTSSDRRKKVSVTITGRVIDVESLHS